MIEAFPAKISSNLKKLSSVLSLIFSKDSTSSSEACFKFLAREFNTPSKMSISHLSNDYSGYRVCLSINEKKGDFYVGYRNHFFLINNDRVNLHLFDSGLLTIPFEYCVSRNIDKELYIDDIPDEKEQISIEGMDKVKLTSKDDLKYKKLETEIETLKQENKKLKELDAIKLEDKEKSINERSESDKESKDQKFDEKKVVTS